MAFAYPPINLVAILVAAVAQFVLGWVWYSSASPTGKRWMAEMGITTMPSPSPKVLLYLGGSVITGWVIAMTYGWSGGATLSDGITVGLMLSLPRVVAEIAEGIAMGGRSMAYIVVQDGYHLIGFGLMGAIIAVMS